MEILCSWIFETISEKNIDFTVNGTTEIKLTLAFTLATN